MQPLPTHDLRHNLGTWAVPAQDLPALGALLKDALPPEQYDAGFHGQRLATTYFDTAAFDLRKARVAKHRYLTLRMRCYDGATYALSTKTESGKFRVELDPVLAERILRGGFSDLAAYEILPADLLARLRDLTDGAVVVPVATVCCRRYAVEDDSDRLTLDVDVAALGKVLPWSVLEFKSTQPGSALPGRLSSLRLRPVKLSKFLWATEV